LKHEYDKLMERADDYAYEERRKKLWDKQSLAWYQWPCWIATALLVAVWIRILYLASVDLVTYLASLSKLH
jgi:hypothetical protein